MVLSIITETTPKISMNHSYVAFDIVDKLGIYTIHMYNERQSMLTSGNQLVHPTL